MSTGKFSASKRRAEARQAAAVEAQGAAAASELDQMLAGLVSDKVGTVDLRRSSRTTPIRGEDPMAWLDRQEEAVQDALGGEQEEDGLAMMDTEEDLTTLIGGTPDRKMTPLGRGHTGGASTPIMSNASKKRLQQQRMAFGAATAATASEDDEPLPLETPVPPVNVESPWPVEDITAQSKPYPLTPMTGQLGSQTATGSSHRDYLRYYNALLAYTQEKRLLQERILLDRQGKEEEQGRSVATTAAMVEGSDDGDINTMPFVMVDEDLVRQESVTELEFLKALNGLCWDRDPTDDQVTTLQPARNVNNMNSVARKEGNFWLLLFSLRQLGLPCLVWDDDEASQRQNAEAVSVYLRTLASRVYATPLEVYQDLQDSSERPLSIRRRQQILRWLQQCFDKVLPPGVTRPRRTTNILTTSTFVNSGLPSTDKDAELMQASLALILAGRLEDALELMRESGIPMRAALWSGGMPYGYEERPDHDKQELDRVPVGNTRRALWRRSMWAHSEQLLQQSTSNATLKNQDEAAIASILASNLKNALANASLRTWEKGLFAAFSCVLGRLEDEALHMHNNQRRQMRPPFPGTEYKAKEQEQLRATDDFASMAESQLVEMLSTTPFEEMQGNDLVTLVTASFLTGRTGIANFFCNTPVDASDEAGLRFLTHLALYVDSLEACTSPVILVGLKAYKVDVLLRYLEHLASREDLWHMMVLYASKLPDSLILDHLPRLLSPITKPEEREITVNQLHDFLTTSGFDLEILRRLVRLVMDQGTDGMAVEAAADSPTTLDVNKMKAITWLCFFEEHWLDALICTNSLLRQFLLKDKIASATLFVRDFVPDPVVETAASGEKAESTASEPMEKNPRQAELSKAKVEYFAYQSYLEALHAAETWREVLGETSAVTPLVDDSLVDTSVLNPTEVAIASSQEKRELLKEKQQASALLARVAKDAEAALRGVLEMPGGFLLTEDEEIVGQDNNTEEEMERRVQLQKLRVHLLPGVVFSYLEVCTETAAWMSKSLDDGVERLGGTAESVLSSLTKDMSTENDDDNNSSFSPQHWTNRAMDVAQLVATEEYDILSAFGTSELQQLLSRLADTAVAGMLDDSSQREKFVTKTASN